MIGVSFVETSIRRLDSLVVLAVAAFEGLPAIVTIVLSLGTTTLPNAIRLFVNYQRLKLLVQANPSHLIKQVL